MVIYRVAVNNQCWYSGHYINTAFAVNYLACVTLRHTRYNMLIGASLSEPHTSGTALGTCVCMFACLLAAIYRKFSMSAVKC